MAYTIDGQEYPFLAKDELERALPVLKKYYLTYSEVAGKTVDYMFYDLFKNYTAWKAEVLGSSCFINDGHGHFTRKDLAPDLQLSPIFSFQRLDSGNTWLAGGNFFGTMPYEGRYDAASLEAFSISRDTSGQTRLLSTKAEVRDLQWIHTARFGDVLVEARNNDTLSFLHPTDSYVKKP